MGRPRWQGKLKLNTSAGMLLRLRVHERDGYTCQECGWRPDPLPVAYDGSASVGSWQFPAERELQLDHVFPRALGGEPVFENLQTLCAPCNRRKHAKVPVAA